MLSKSVKISRFFLVALEAITEQHDLRLKKYKKRAHLKHHCLKATSLMGVL